MKRFAVLAFGMMAAAGWDAASPALASDVCVDAGFRSAMVGELNRSQRFRDRGITVASLDEGRDLVVNDSVVKCAWTVVVPNGYRFHITVQIDRKTNGFQIDIVD